MFTWRVWRRHTLRMPRRLRTARGRRKAVWVVKKPAWSLKHPVRKQQPTGRQLVVYHRRAQPQMKRTHRIVVPWNRAEQRKHKPNKFHKPKQKKFDIEQYTSSIESELQNEPKPKIDLSGPSLKWPSELTPIFAISLRAHRFNHLLERMKQWSSLITLVPATDGRQLTPELWRRLKRLRGHLANGQIGCYESHVRVWQRIVDQRLPSALVLEDDAAITYTQDTVDKLNQFLSELKTVFFDVAYIGNVGLHPVKQQLSKSITEPSNWEGLYTYLITLAGARKLLKNAFPITQAVDLYVGEQARLGNIRTVSMTPPLNFVVPVESDTDKRILK